MHRIFPSLLASMCFLFTGQAVAQTVLFNEANFPDPAVRQFLATWAGTSLSTDAEGRTVLDTRDLDPGPALAESSAAATVTDLDCLRLFPANTLGIFPQSTWPLLTRVDVSGTAVTAVGNGVTSAALDESYLQTVLTQFRAAGCAALSSVQFRSAAALAVLDLANCPALTTLELDGGTLHGKGYGHLRALDISASTSLTGPLAITGMAKLHTLRLPTSRSAGVTPISTIDIQHTVLSTIDLSVADKASAVHLGFGRLRTLQFVSTAPQAPVLDCQYNDLQSMVLSSPYQPVATLTGQTCHMGAAASLTIGGVGEITNPIGGTVVQGVYTPKASLPVTDNFSYQFAPWYGTEWKLPSYTVTVKRTAPLAVTLTSLQEWNAATRKLVTRATPVTYDFTQQPGTNTYQSPVIPQLIGAYTIHVQKGTSEATELYGSTLEEAQGAAVVLTPSGTDCTLVHDFPRTTTDTPSWATASNAAGLPTFSTADPRSGLMDLLQNAQVTVTYVDTDPLGTMHVAAATTTAIDAVGIDAGSAVNTAHGGDEGWYNLQGIRLGEAPASTGVYIHRLPSGQAIKVAVR